MLFWLPVGHPGHYMGNSCFFLQWCHVPPWHMWTPTIISTCSCCRNQQVHSTWCALGAFLQQIQFEIPDTLSKKCSEAASGQRELQTIPPQGNSSSNRSGEKVQKLKNKFTSGGEYVPGSAIRGEKLRGLSGFIRAAGLHPRIILP